MMIFWRTKKRTLFLLSILLSIAILCAQGVKLHVHSLDHDHEQQHSNISSLGVAEHSDMSLAHLSADISHTDHHDEAVSEIDASPDGLLKKGASNIPEMALLAAIFTSLLLGFYQHTFHRRRDNEAIFRWRYHFSPPLRAPPL